MAVECQAVNAGRCPTLQSSRPRARVRSPAAAHRNVGRRPDDDDNANGTIQVSANPMNRLLDIVGTWPPLTALVAVLLLAAPVAVEAIPRVGLLSDEALTDDAAAGAPAVREGLRAIGYVEGQNIVVESRLAEWNSDRLPSLAQELVRLKVDIVVAIGGPAARAAKNATQTTPIVFARVGDPVGLGLVSTIGRPGGNITGVSVAITEFGAKRLELLREAVPGLKRVGALLDPTFPPAALELKVLEGAARSLRVELDVSAVRDVKEFERALLTMTRKHVGAVEVLPSQLFTGQRNLITDLVAKSRLPAMFQRSEFVAAGGLMSYGPSYTEMYRRVAVYVDRIIKGAKPADLPVEQPTKLELVINQKTAKALGLKISPSLLLRADQIVE